MPHISNYTGDQIDELVVKSDFVNLIYPIGSIYFSVNSTSPATLFGGTWTRIQEKFLLGWGSPGENTTTDFGQMYDMYTGKTAGATGGEISHTLIESEMPSHNHMTPGLHYDSTQLNSTFLTQQNDGNFVVYKQNSSTYTDITPTWYSGAPSVPITPHQRGFTSRAVGTTSNSVIDTTNWTSTGTTNDNNIPPYLAVYMWERTG